METLRAMSQQQAEKKTYRNTLNLPRTKFAMRANLIQNEPASQKRWAAADLYGQLRRAPHPKGPFVFHDGPPYANGSIHLGHLLNKVLKDFVVRTKTMGLKRACVQDCLSALGHVGTVFGALGSLRC